MSKRIYQELARMVKQARKIKNITQVDLAERIGVTKPTMSRIETGEAQLLLHNAIALWKVLEFDIKELLKYVRVYQ